MAEVVRYVTRVEARVVVVREALSGGELPVGEFVVHGEARSVAGAAPTAVDMVDAAMMAARKRARAMAAGVDNNEKARKAES